MKCYKIFLQIDSKWSYYMSMLRKKSATALKENMMKGRVYRRNELAAWTKAVDRDLKTLTETGEVVKAGAGLYYRPKTSPYGPLPADERELIRAFLGDDNFLSVSPNLYSQLGVGLTQVYNTTTVYNRKRHETVTLDGKRFEFRRPRDFPRKLSVEFLLVDLLDNLNRLPEDTSAVTERIKAKSRSVDAHELVRAARRYGKVATKRFFDGLNLRDEHDLSA